MKDVKGFLDGFIEFMESEDEKNTKVVATFPPTEKELATLMEMKAMFEAIKLAEKKLEVKKTALWASVHDRKNDYVSSYRFNEKTKEIEKIVRIKK